MHQDATIRVVIADDHALFRDALRLVLELQGGFLVVGEARDGDEAVQQVLATRPDVLLLDVAMPRASGFDALRALTGRPTPRTVLLTAAISGAEVTAAVALGACGILLKDATSELLRECVRTVANGGLWIAKDQMRDLVEGLSDRPRGGGESRAPIDTLTRREREIIAGVVDGAGNRDIASALHVSEQTVKNHLSHIFDKLGVSNRLELALHAMHHRLSSDSTHQLVGAAR